MKTITITSKNQITIPASLIRQMGLGKVRRLRVQQKGNSMVLTPQATLDDRFETHWAKIRKYVKRPLSDGEIRQARQQAHEGRAARLVSRVKADDAKRRR